MVHGVVNDIHDAPCKHLIFIVLFTRNLSAWCWLQACNNVISDNLQVNRAASTSVTYVPVSPARQAGETSVWFGDLFATSQALPHHQSASYPGKKMRGYILFWKDRWTTRQKRPSLPTTTWGSSKRETHRLNQSMKVGFWSENGIVTDYEAGILAPWKRSAAGFNLFLFV